MDMHVNPEVFSRANSSMNNHCNVITCMTKAFSQRVDMAHADFDDVNYDRTREAVTRLQAKIGELSNKVAEMGRDMKAIQEIVCDYLDGGYKR